ncbi:hypothetical protein [Myxosarcina sp. GI1]|uniref:hypothetical protein n=1 Tax=Myxosarcina sp. GI1 TaxID=1541065 RepID=UPI00055DAD93|nr:hypothetical protein [Myxosarcina sp. GI1]
MNSYIPVSCDLHDRLEAIATLKQSCQINFQNDDRELKQVYGKIIDIYAAEGADWCRLDDDTIIRLDKIESFAIE